MMQDLVKWIPFAKDKRNIVQIMMSHLLVMKVEAPNVICNSLTTCSSSSSRYPLL
jgi:hypothetical protein